MLFFNSFFLSLLETIAQQFKVIFTLEHKKRQSCVTSILPEFTVDQSSMSYSKIRIILI